MAKSVKAAKQSAPDRLTMSLSGPGMTVLHRAGLGGLACTLRYLERAYRRSVLLEEDLPGPLRPDSSLPWEMNSGSITLLFDKPDRAREYLRKLFSLSFGIKDGLIHLPGQYGSLTPSLAVRAELQNGLTLTFLQHGKSRQLAKSTTTFQFDPVGDGKLLVTVEYKVCSGYRHQDGWQDLTDEKTGCLRCGLVEVAGPLNPGAVVRHVKYTADTRVEDPPERILPLFFAVVGCLALPINRGVGVLVAPDVENLTIFAHDRPLMTPTTPEQCRIASVGDAALRAQVRLRQRGLLAESELPSCHASVFRPASWSTQQKSRVETLLLERQEVHRYQPEHASTPEYDLTLFEIALAELRPRVHAPAEAGKKGIPTGGLPIGFWIDSRIRPLVADNLARGRPWYADFVELMRSKEASERLGYEKKELAKMVELLTPEDFPCEATLVKAIQEAIRKKLYHIRRDTQPNNQHGPLKLATKNRQKRFMERFRLALVGAKTEIQCREAIARLLGQALYNPQLQEAGWRQVLPLLFDSKQWQRSRDLALLALASYSPRKPRTSP